MVARVVLGVALIALVLAAAAAARHPRLDKQPFVSPSAGGMIVLDLSASIGTDTFSRIGESLRELVAKGGRYGLVVFSSSAYEALPPGTPVSALKPIIRYFTLPKEVVAGEQATFPLNPWTNSFTSGTRISQGLDLARQIEVANHARHPTVVLISDLADDPTDQDRLPGELQLYLHDKIHLKIVALNAAPNDQNFFKQLLGQATSITAATLPGQNPSATKPAHAAFPSWIVFLTVLVAALLAANELRSARLRWGTAEGAPG
jgi:hypothetical protein